MKILAIETSCDETAIAILECSGELPTPAFKVLANNLQSQIHIHKEYGGVYPMLAKREHIKNLPILLEKTLAEAPVDTKCPQIDYIAVTAGPGLEPALWAGITFAEELGQKWGKPVIPVNHMSGHLFSFMFEQTKSIEFPAIALLVSGGHTELVHVEGFDKYKIIGRTRDDAVGEAFDKTARLLDLPYPGGPKISALAEVGRSKNQESGIKFPRPMINTDDFDFSYSGLKTAVLYKIRELGELNDDTKIDIALAFEEAALEPLVVKTQKALEEFNAKTLIVGGGVSANKTLRQRLSELAQSSNVDLRLPAPGLSTDNAIMIGISAYVGLISQSIAPSRTIIAKGNLAF